MRVFSLFRNAFASDSRQSHRQACRSHGLRRALSVESLEMRQLLAADVAVVDNGDDVSFAAIVAQLNDNTQGLNITATLVQPSDVDSVAELNAFDTVVLASDGLNPDSFPVFAAALNDWVQNQGGGVVAVGFAAFGIRGGPEESLLDAILPIAITGSGETFESAGSVLDIDPGHPVTAGVNDITVAASNFFESVGPPADAWGTVLGDYASTNLGVVAGAVPSGGNPGRSVYLGPNYGGASSSYNTADLRSGDADRLLEQAVNWAANVAASVPPVITTNTGSTVAQGGADTITQGELETTDADTPASGLTYTVSSAPVNGTLSSLIFTQADINAGTVTYTHNGSATASDSFAFNVSDGTTTVPGTFNFTVTSGVLVSVAVSDGSAAEPANDGAFTVTLSQPVGTDTTVTYNVTGASTATNGVDYQPLTGFLVIPAGSTAAVLPIDVIDDALVEGPETVFVALSTVSSGVTIDPANDDAELTIGDNDIAGPGPTVAVDSNGTLIIDGTSDNDTVTVTGVGTGTGQYIVTTQQGNGPVVTQSVFGVKGIDINLRAGDDDLTMNNVYVPNAIQIEMEDGNDTVILGNVDVVSSAQNLGVSLGAGDDVIDGKRLYIGGDQSISGGDGHDDLIFEGFAEPTFTLGTSAAGTAVWQGDAGDDLVSVVYGFIVESWVIELGDGTDVLEVFGSAASGDVVFSGEGGDDTLAVDTNFFDASQLLLGGEGNDTVFLANGLGSEFTSIETGAGNDDITVQNQATSQLSVATGAGADEVDIRASAVDRFFASLGDDNDTLTGRGNLVRLQTALDGGAGNGDRLIDLGNSFQGDFSAVGFELFGNP